MSGPTIEHAILDRDGVLNRESDAGWLADAAQWEWEAGSLEALQVLARAGIKMSIVTNQSGIGRGLVSQQEVDRIHAWLRDELAAAGVGLVGIYLCPHAPGEECRCRKPRPGLVEQAIEDSEVNPDRTILIGDDQRDLEAGRAAGVAVALVRTGKGQRVAEQEPAETLVFDNLLAAAAFLADRTPLSLIGS